MDKETALATIEEIKEQLHEAKVNLEVIQALNEELKKEIAVMLRNIKILNKELIEKLEEKGLER